MDTKEFIEAEKERYRQTRPGEDYEAIHGARDRALLEEEHRSEKRFYMVLIGTMLTITALIAIPGRKDEPGKKDQETISAVTGKDVKIAPLEDGKTFRMEMDGTSVEEAKARIMSFIARHPDATLKDYKIDEKNEKIIIDISVEK